MTNVQHVLCARHNIRCLLPRFSGYVFMNILIRRKCFLREMQTNPSYNDEIGLSIKGTLGNMMLCNVNMNAFASIAQLLYF